MNDKLQTLSNYSLRHKCSFERKHPENAKIICCLNVHCKFKKLIKFFASWSILPVSTVTVAHVILRGPRC